MLKLDRIINYKGGIMKLKDELKTVEVFTDPINNNLIKKRVYNTLVWNIKKATYYKRFFYSFSIILLILNATVPIINQLNNYSIWVTIISSIGFVITSMLTLINFKDVWYRYRLTSEIIKSECMKLNCKIGEYENEDREKRFLNKFESILSDERNLWINSRFNNQDEANLEEGTNGE